MPAPCFIEAFLDSITLHVDDDVRVIDKPAGLAVQKGTATTEHLDGMLIERAKTTGERLRLVHRLDQDTSGCLVLAASREAARWLGRELMGRRVVKTYWALVHGVPEPRVGVIDLPLIKAAGPAGDRVRAANAEELEGAWPAVTHYEVLQARLETHAFVALTPETGRQHQLRAHLAAIGHPIVGDRKYAVAAPAVEEASAGQGCGLHLLARAIAFRHPRGHWITCTAPLPPHMRMTFQRLGLAAEMPSTKALRDEINLEQPKSFPRTARQRRSGASPSQ